MLDLEESVALFAEISGEPDPGKFAETFCAGVREKAIRTGVSIDGQTKLFDEDDIRKSAFAFRIHCTEQGKKESQEFQEMVKRHSSFFSSPMGRA